MSRTIAIRRPAPRRMAAVALLAALLAGVAADCEKQGGYYQGGGDSTPGWRNSMTVHQGR